MKKISKGLLAISLVMVLSAATINAKKDYVKKDSLHRTIQTIKYHSNGKVREKDYFSYYSNTKSIVSKKIYKYNSKGKRVYRNLSSYTVKKDDDGIDIEKKKIHITTSYNNGKTKYNNVEHYYHDGDAKRKEKRHYTKRGYKKRYEIKKYRDDDIYRKTVYHYNHKGKLKSTKKSKARCVDYYYNDDEKVYKKVTRHYNHKGKHHNKHTKYYNHKGHRSHHNED